MHFILLLIVFTFLLLFYNFYWKLRNYPNGPIPLPLVGNIFSMKSKKRFEYTFVEWAKQYGPIYTYWLGETPVVTVNDAKLAHQIFVKEHADNFVDRGFKFNLQAILGEDKKAGVIMTDGQVWQDQRRFALRFLRDFGLGKNQMQERIIEEIHTLIENINKDIKSGADEFDLYKHTDIAVGSIINSLVFGYHFTRNNKEAEFYRLKDLNTEAVNNGNSTLLFLGQFNKFLMAMCIKLFPNMFKPLKDVFDFFDDQIKQRIKSEEIDEDTEPQDLVDAFLVEKARQKRLNLPTADLYSMSQLRGLTFDIWFAGQETTSSTLTWGIAYLIKFPKVQENIHKELDRVVGSDRIVTVADRQSLNYTNAFIMEVQRASNIVSQNLLRLASEDIEVNGIKIRKGTYCFAQISALHYDPEIFPDPDSIKPERFLDKNGNLIRNDEKLDALLPFSLGKRVCPGEGLARMELFLFIANLCNQYKFFAGKEEPVLEKMNHAASPIIPYKCGVEKRFSA